MSQIFTNLTKEEFRAMLREELKQVITDDQKGQKDTGSTEEFLTVEETCKLIKISKPTLYERMKDGSIPFIRLGSRLLFVKEDVLNAIKKKGGA